MSFIKIENVLQGKTKTGLKKQIDYALALERAEKILDCLLGEHAKEYFKPAYVQYRCLTVACMSSEAAAALGRVEKDIIEYVNQGFSQPLVQRIRATLLESQTQ